jgi:hypothetical protein
MTFRSEGRSCARFSPLLPCRAMEARTAGYAEDGHDWAYKRDVNASVYAAKLFRTDTHNLAWQCRSFIGLLHVASSSAIFGPEFVSATQTLFMRRRSQNSRTASNLCYPPGDCPAKLWRTWRQTSR